jgi:hypothetical protein
MLANSDRVVNIRDGRVEKIRGREELAIEEGQISVGGEALS